LPPQVVIPPSTLPAPPLVGPNSFAKGGKQNWENEWNDRAREAAGNSIEAQREWLKEAYKNADAAVRQKIKQAQKAIGGRRSSGGGP